MLNDAHAYFACQSIGYGLTSPFNGSDSVRFLDQSQVLIDALRELSVEDVAKLMDLSAKLSELNVQRYRDFHLPFSAHNAKQAVFAFNGDVYEGLSASQLSTDQIHWLQDHLRILSGLYGLLRPLDYMQPYRLEMGTSFANSRGKNLYAFGAIG